MALDWLELGDELFLTRKEFFALLGALSCVGGWRPSQGSGEQGVSLALEELKAAEKLAGLEFTDEQRQQILSAVQRNVQEIQRLHSLSFDYTLEPPLIFRPGLVPKDGFLGGIFSLELRNVSRPSSSNDLAFLSVRELSILIQTRQVSPVSSRRFTLIV